MSTIYRTMEITKEIFDLCPNGHVPDEVKPRLFSEAIRYGYGLYGTKVYEENGKYYCEYCTGTSCD